MVPPPDTYIHSFESIKLKMAADKTETLLSLQMIMHNLLIGGATNHQHFHPNINKYTYICNKLDISL